MVAEQNLGQFAALLRIRINNFVPYQYNQVKGQPFVVNELVKGFESLLTTPEIEEEGLYYDTKIIQ